MEQIKFSTDMREFENGNIYGGDDLGFTYTKEETVFRLWAPTADAVSVEFYERGDGGRSIGTTNMKKSKEGVWIAKRSGNLNHIYYTFRVTRNNQTKETQDPYAKAVGVNGLRSMVLDLRETDPEGFSKDQGPKILSATRAIVAEISIRDISSHASAEVDVALQGKFLGLCDLHGKPMTYLKRLGVTHVQIMPFYDFGSVDESREIPAYNWGYDPVNYHVPEGSYSTNPFRGEERIRQCKQMIAAFHRMGIGVIMDVVYNHVFDVENSCLQKCEPDYFFRKYEDGSFGNGSGCGNELATERYMVRKYILDSLKFWMTEYHVDGFRFDLLGVYDQETVRSIEKELRKINPYVILYGEGWTGGYSAFPEQQRAVKWFAGKMKGIGVFSDDIRDTIKGSVFSDEATGFVNGSPQTGEQLRYSIAGASFHPQVDYASYGFTQGGPWAMNPSNVVNYVSCHDNLTLWDKLMVSAPWATEEQRLCMNRLAAAIVFTSQGMPLFLLGEEALRSKPLPEGGYSSNSYNKPLSVNELHYPMEDTSREEMYEYYCGLIAFRKAFADFLCMETASEVAEHLHFWDTDRGVVAFEIHLQNRKLLVAYNGNFESRRLVLPEGSRFQVYLNDRTAGPEALYTVTGELEIPASSAVAALWTM